MISLTNLTITNFDEDHVSDLPNIYEYCKPRELSKNWNINSLCIRRGKSLMGIGEGVSTACKMIDEYTGPALDTDWGGVTVKRFRHGLNDFNYDDENSLSLVTFLMGSNIRIVFPGDLTVAAWEKFLLNQEFCDLLSRVNIFVASHHGRKDGYCPEVFKYCKPDIIIVSDKEIMHETQKVNYGSHATGITWDGDHLKKCVTTRSDGAIHIQSKTSGGYFVQAGYAYA
jgi:beta-lactamase superfamily II metal-dependent hydrolase